MILPSKHVGADRALIGVGGEVLRLLDRPMTVSRLWDELRHRRQIGADVAPLDYRWFILSLDLLYILGAVEHKGGTLRRATS